MPNAVIVDVLRTPLGRRNGKLKDQHPVDLAALVLREIVERTGVDPALIDLDLGMTISPPETP